MEDKERDLKELCREEEAFEIRPFVFPLFSSFLCPEKGRYVSITQKLLFKKMERRRENLSRTAAAVACKLQCLLSRLVNQDVAMPKIWYRLFRFLMVCGVGTEIYCDVYFRLFLLNVFTFFFRR